MTDVYLETGKAWTFACSVDWPGWCRRGKGEEAALEALQDYAARYAEVVGDDFSPGSLRVIGRVAGDATTDFGAPGARGEWDGKRLTGKTRDRQLDVLRKTWSYFDRVVAAAPATLRKGPRGGGRDRDAIVDHVREAERAYARKVGVRVPPRTPWEEQRGALLDGLRAPDAPAWPPRYVIRRVAWHVLDHAWEIQDRAD